MFLIRSFDLIVSYRSAKSRNEVSSSVARVTAKKEGCVAHGSKSHVWWVRVAKRYEIGETFHSQGRTSTNSQYIFGNFINYIYNAFQLNFLTNLQISRQPNYYDSN